jgi:hypothetical protein
MGTLVIGTGTNSGCASCYDKYVKPRDLSFVDDL